MSISPAPTIGKTLPVSHFPTDFQTAIFRLWECVPCAQIAKVLKTSPDNIYTAAKAMGLPEQEFLTEWHDRGYISIIRAMWNLMPYEQILELLDYTEERLNFILKEDDFLGIKLGEKCDCKEVLWRELTSAEAVRTAEIKATIEKYVTPLVNAPHEAPFDFYNKERYAPLCTGQEGSVKVDSSWALIHPTDNSLLLDMIEDFKCFAAKYNVTFQENGEKKITLSMDIVSDDEEYHELEITENQITIRAAEPVGILRGLYELENQADLSGSFSFNPCNIKRKSKMKIRYIFSFSSLFSDVLDCDTHISFPDELLEGYGRRSVNGVFIQGILSTISPYPFAPEKAAGWEARLANLDSLCRRAARYGVKIYMYINEPRPIALEYFEKHPEHKGQDYGRAGTATLCSSHPDVHKYLHDAMYTVCTGAPLMGGFFTITQTENLVTCYSTKPRKDLPLCPVCSQREASVVTAEILNAIASGISDASDKIRLIVYGWSYRKTIGEEQHRKLISLLPKNAIYLQVSESSIPTKIGGIAGEVGDYSLSIVGPGEIAKGEWALAKQYGLETMAKVQINNSWECSTAPFLPVFDNVVAHMSNLTEFGVENVMLSWTLGGYISDNLKIASSYFFENANGEKEDVYANTLKNTYGTWADTVRKAASCFTNAFKEYPFSVGHMYNGPSNAGVANLLYPEPSNMHCTMTCYPYDDLKNYRSIYPEDVLLSQYEKVCLGWEKGLELIKDMPICEFKDMAFYGYTLFASSRNQIQYTMERDGEKRKDIMDRILVSEKELAKMALEICLRNSAVGYEAANHYYFPRFALFEKLVQCEYLLNK